MEEKHCALCQMKDVAAEAKEKTEAQEPWQSMDKSGQAVWKMGEKAMYFCHWKMLLQP